MKLDHRHEHVYARPMFLAGIPVDDRLVLVLAGMLRDAGLDTTAEKLENGYDRETKILALSIADPESILRVIEGGPDEYVELRATLLKEHEWRVREGLG
jgi:hypothetical protein